MQLRWDITFKRSLNELVVRLNEYTDAGLYNDCVAIELHDLWPWERSEEQLQARIKKMQYKCARHYTKNRSRWDWIRTILSRFNGTDAAPHLKVVKNDESNTGDGPRVA